MTRRKRFEMDYGLAPYAAEVLTATRPVADYFEETMKSHGDARGVANWIMGDVLRIMNEQKLEISRLRITPQRLGALLGFIEDGTVSAKAARKVFDLMQSENKEPSMIIEEHGLRQVSDTGALETAVKKILDEHPGEVERYRGGERKLMGFFVGQAMKATRGTGNPKEINAILTRLLE